MEAIILAGGLGTRLRSTVPSLPKPMAPIKGKPFLWYLLNYWLDQGIKHFILSAGYKYEVIREQFGTKYKDTDINYSIENEALGTGGGLLLAIKQLRTKQPFLLLNGDTFFAVNLNNLLQYHKNCKSDMTLSLVKIKQNKRYSSVLLDKHGLICSIGSPTNSSKNGMANGGVYIIDPLVLTVLDYKAGDVASLEDELLPNLVKHGGRLYGLNCLGKFIDIGVPSDYYRAEEVLSS